MISGYFSVLIFALTGFGLCSPAASADASTVVDAMSGTSVGELHDVFSQSVPVLALYHDDSTASEKILSSFKATEEHFRHVSEEKIAFMAFNMTRFDSADKANSKFLKENSIFAFPTVKWVTHGVMIDYIGGRKSQSMIDWVTHRSVDHPLTYLNSEDTDGRLGERLDEAKADADLVVIGLFPSLKTPPPQRSALEAFVAVSQLNHKGVTARFIAMQDTKAAAAAAGFGEIRHSKDARVLVLHRTFGMEEPPIEFQEEQVGQLALTRFVHDHRTPLVMTYSEKSAAAIFTNDIKAYVFVLVDEARSQKSTKFVGDVVEESAAAFKGKGARFVVVPFEDPSTRAIFHLFDLDESSSHGDLPAVRMLVRNEGTTGIDLLKNFRTYKFSAGGLNSSSDTAMKSIASADVDAGDLTEFVRSNADLVHHPLLAKPLHDEL